MRVTLLTILTICAITAAARARAQTYDPRYPICLQAFGLLESINCSFTSMAQCKLSTGIRAAQCIVNPYYSGARRARLHT